jgi:hypothetical protein
MKMEDRICSQQREVSRTTRVLLFKMVGNEHKLYYIIL